MSRKANKSKPSMPLEELAERYINTPRRGMKPKSAEQLRLSVVVFERWLACRATAKHLTAETVNQFVQSRLENFSASTAKRNRMHLILLWRFAAKEKLITTRPHPDDVPTVTIPRKNPTAWTLPELEKLLAACRLLPGNMPAVNDVVAGSRQKKYRGFRGVPRWKWWSSLVLFLYDTGARVSAALAVTPADIDLERGIVVLRGDSAKTGLEQVLRLSRQTTDAIRLIYDPKAPQVWYWGFCYRQVFYHLTKIVKAAGLPADRSRKFHCLRKTCATLTAAAGRRDLAQSTLGHTSGEITSRYYIDRRAAPSESAASVLPRPRIDGESPSVAASSEPSNGDADVLAKLSPDELATLLKLAKALTPKNCEAQQ